MTAWPVGWRGLVAEVTKYYHWGPEDAWRLKLSRFLYWYEEAKRLKDMGVS
ncbi:hypothetical protein OH687_29060 [Burkholderia anthina]|nr:hypothetical protein OH687_29060 [Burkholderia anthina]